MKKALIVLIVIILGYLLFNFATRTQPLLPTAGSNIIVFGDSLAEGQGASTGHDIASLLSEQLEQEVINLGVSGDTTADALARIDEVVSNDPKVVIILLGGNDALDKTPMETIFSNLGEIIKAIQATGAAVILVGEPGGLYGKPFKKGYENLAKKHQTFYIENILSGLIGRPEYMSDYIHPNDKGYEKAVERILPVVEDALSD